MVVLFNAWDCSCEVGCLIKNYCEKWHFRLCGLEYGDTNPVYSSIPDECMTTLFKTPLVSATTSGCKGRRLLTDTEV